MKIVREWTTQEITYKYDSEMERDAHEVVMVSMGFTVAPQPIFMQHDLQVTYQKRILQDNVPRF